jgi:uncharacterized protein (TIGR02757 family)
VELKARLDREVQKRNHHDELSAKKPDPIMVAKRYNDETISLICALFAYGNATLIVKFLDGLDFSLLEKSELEIQNILSSSYYRFQKSADVAAFFITLKRAKELFSLEEKFLEGYKKNEDILEGLATLILALKALHTYESYGYNFLLGKAPTTKSTSTYKRWLMYLRWMVRKDQIDMGLWKGVDKKDLLIPLDTHTFKVSQKLGLLKRKQYDLKAVKELTHKLKTFDEYDPVKYDFALYRLGQEKEII